MRRVIARLARVVAADTPCADYADFKAALRTRLAQLHIRYQPIDFDDAITVVTSNTRLWGAPPAAVVSDTRTPEPPLLSKAEAAAVLAQLQHRVRTMPRPRPTPYWPLALRQLLQAVSDQAARVAALEAEADQ